MKETAERRADRYAEFTEDLTALISVHRIDTDTQTPAPELADMLADIVKRYARAMRVMKSDE